MLNGDTRIIAHVGYPTTTFKSPMIYNPWFEKRGINAAVVPLGVRSEDFARAFPEICRFTNFHGALITMPHKIAVIGLIDEVSTAVKVAGSCNAVRRNAEGRLVGDMFDGEGFVRGMARHGALAQGQEGSRRRVGRSGLGDRRLVRGRGRRRDRALRRERRRDGGARGAAQAELSAAQGFDSESNDPTGFDVVVNATPLGMKAGDPMPVDVSRLSPSTYVGEVVMKQETTAFLAAARARGCETQIGIDMLFEQIPAYLEFFGFPSATPTELRAVAKVDY